MTAASPEPMISLACYRAMMDAVMQYVPVASRQNALDAATAIGIGYEPKVPQRRRPSRKSDA